MVEDPYAWLEDLSSEETLAFIREHNVRFKEFVGDLPSKLLGRVRHYFSVPYVNSFRACGEGVFAVVRSAGEFRVVLIDWGGGVEEVLSSRGLGDDAVISEAYPSPGGDVLGVSYTLGGSDEGFLRFIDLRSRKVIDELRGAVGNVIWVDDCRYYYVRMYRSGRAPDGVKAPAERVFLRELGGDEELVFGEGLPTNHLVSLDECNDPLRVFITVWRGWSSSRVYGGLLKDPSTWRLLLDAGDCLIKPAGYFNGAPYLIMYDGGGLGRLVRVSGSGVEEVIPECGYPLENALIAGGKAVANYLINASSRLRIHGVDGSLIREIMFNEPLSVRGMRVFNDAVILQYEGFSKPSSLGILDLKEGSLRELYGHEGLKGVEVREFWVTSSDGVRVHAFMVSLRGKVRGRHALVYGYGGFGISLTPTYLGPLIPFLEDGGVFVMANIRGGGEFGEGWHRDGMRDRKQNVFEDFKAVLKHLRGEGFRIIGYGRSNGGLLIAAVLTQAPELLNATVIGYPLTDMLKYHKLYVGSLWVSEYGNPDNPEDREYLIKYSPYHNVRKGVKYPPTLILTGLHDDRVHPAHALKFTAKLEEVGAPVYLRVETASGHRGATPETKVREYSDVLAFIYRVLGIND